MKATAQIIKEWEDSGLLKGVEKKKDKRVLAEELEKAAKDPVILYSALYRGACETTLFPIICRLMKAFGYRPIDVRSLYADIFDRWEEYIRLPQAQKVQMSVHLEAEFCAWYTERYGRVHFLNSGAKSASTA